MRKIKTKFKDLSVFHSKSHADTRGYFRELVLEKEVKTKLFLKYLQLKIFHNS